MNLYIKLPTTATNEFKIDYPIHIGDKSRQEHREFILSLSNRTLLKEYRQIKEHYNDVNELFNEGSRYYLGERIGKVRSEAIISLRTYEFEVNRRFEKGLISTNK